MQQKFVYNPQFRSVQQQVFKADPAYPKPYWITCNVMTLRTFRQLHEEGRVSREELIDCYLRMYPNCNCYSTMQDSELILKLESK